MIKSIKEENERIEHLSKEQCQELIDVCSPHLKPIVLMALNTGARRGEILSLQWKQVDLKHKFIRLNKTKNGKPRTIPINETLRATLEAIPHGPESLYVFTDRNGNRYKSVDTSFPTACRRAGIADFHFHDLRHTFASQLAEAKVPIATLSRLLGHKRLVSTMRYAHLSDSHMINAVKLLDKNNGVSDTVSDTVLSGGEYGEL
jgi:integrase